MIGILIALQLSNWNQDREKDEAFKTTIEQIYTHLHAAKEVDAWDISVSEEQLDRCRKMKLNLDALDHDFTNYKEKYFEPIFRANALPRSAGQPRQRIKYAEPGENILLPDFAIEKIDSIKRTREFTSALISTEERLTKITWILNYRRNENIAVREMLLRYDPQLNLRYDNLVISGSLKMTPGVALTFS